MAQLTRSALIRLGYLYPDHAESLVAGLERVRPDLGGLAAELCSTCADPDQGLASLADLATVIDLTTLDRDPQWSRLIELLGTSQAFGRWLKIRPSDIDQVFNDPLRWSRGDILADMMAAIGSDGWSAPQSKMNDLRWSYRRHLLRIATRDVTSDDPGAILMDVCGELSDLADATVECGVHIARSMVPHADRVRFGVVALGKAGARELNYVSDVDLLYIAEPALDAQGEPRTTVGEAIDIATKLVAALTQACSSYTAAGTIWDLDANLRPEGGAGPVVRTLESMRIYYSTWASNWEFQAMIKARPMAGDIGLAQDFCRMVAPLVWNAAEREGFIADAQAMRARVVDLIPLYERGREIKLGSGGLRDTEFSVQLLQLVHGRADERLRVAATLPALEVLIDHGYVSREDGADLIGAYTLQRLIEHRVQLWRLRRTHLMPIDEASLRRLARSLGMGRAEDVQGAWKASTSTVTRLRQRIFYSPLLEAVARIPSSQVRLTPEAAMTRLKALGYADPQAALRHIQALTSGMTRAADMLRQILPAMLGWMAAGPNPDLGLLAFRQVTEALGSTPWFLRSLRDEGQMAQELATILSTSRYAGSLLQRSPTSVEILLGEGVSKLPDRGAMQAEFTSIVERHVGDNRVGEIIRATRRRELLRIAMADILDYISIEKVGHHLSMMTDVTIDSVLRAAMKEIDDPPSIAIIALGRWGGEEMSFTSDVDLMVVAEDTDDPQDIRKAEQIVSSLRTMVKVPGPDPDIELDFALRPEGKDGPLVRTLSSTLAYYEKWSSPWEFQALVRARFGGGDKAVASAFLSGIDTLRYPTGGLSVDQTVEIRRIKARMETERIGRGIDPKSHVKLGPGGLSDVEWTVQLLQMQHGDAFPQLRLTSTLPALDALTRYGIIEEDDAAALRDAFVLASRIRDAIMLLRGKGSDVLPSDADELGQLAEILGFHRSGGSHLDEAWRKVSRRAHAVANRLFWGEHDPQM